MRSHARGIPSVLLLALSVSALAHAPAWGAGDEQPPEPEKPGIILRATKGVLNDIGSLLTAPARMDRQDALMAAGALALVGGTFAVDRGLRTTVRHNTTSTGQDLADGFNRLGSTGGLLAVNAGAMAVGYLGESHGGSQKLKEAGLIGLEAQGFAIVLSVALKEVTGRSRPGLEQGSSTFSPGQSPGSTSGTGVLQEITSPVREKSTGKFRPFGGQGSFPSTHATSSFAVATVFAERYDWPVGLLAYSLAAAVSASRVYSDEHFTSDVVAGALIGWGIGHFLNKRHPVGSTDWSIRPMAMDQGLGAGLALGRKF
jgi:hypothetical protein